MMCCPYMFRMRSPYLRFLLSEAATKGGQVRLIPFGAGNLKYTAAADLQATAQQSLGYGLYLFVCIYCYFCWRSIQICLESLWPELPVAPCVLKQLATFFPRSNDILLYFSWSFNKSTERCQTPNQRSSWNANQRTSAKPIFKQRPTKHETQGRTSWSRLYWASHQAKNFTTPLL